MVYKEHYITNENKFIGGWYMSPDLCSAIIKKANKVPGFFSDNTVHYVFRFLDQLDSDLYDQYLEQLKDITKLYVKKYSFCTSGAPWRMLNFTDDSLKRIRKPIPVVKFQKYFPNRSYNQFHCENDGAGDKEYTNRNLVFMTYLNTVQDGGETEFFYQNFKCKPESGLTLIWPAEWTHTHRGMPAHNETKYILTGWYVRDQSLTENIYKSDI